MNMPDFRARPGEWQEYRHDSGETIGFRFVRSSRRTIALYVHRDGSVMVRAPLRAPFAEVSHFMRERWEWLQQQRTRFLQDPLPPRYGFADGQPILHLGDEIPLRVVSASRRRALLHEGELRVAVPEPELQDSEALAAVVEAWQRREAQTLFPDRMRHCHERMHELRLPYPQMKIRKMRSRWGSCSRSAVITLNLELVRMPLECIDYVITHELCHLVEFNHSPRFYALQERFEPNWKLLKKRLEELGRR